MAALIQDRNTPQAIGDMREGPVAAATLIYAGAIVMRDASGDLNDGATATGLVGVGRAEKRADNAGGSAGDVTAKYRAGIFRFANSTSTDEIGNEDSGKPCYAVDDQTVALTDGSGTRSIAGFVDHVDARGVWVRFDEALVQTYLAGITEPAA